MAEEKWTCIIDKDLRPAYYDSFHCLMGDCRMSCCKGSWHISFDKNDYQKLKKSMRANPELAQRMEQGLHRLRDKDNAIDRHYAEMRMDDKGSCRMLTEDGLCGLQLAAGEKALPKVCREYPRAVFSRASGYLERSLSPSCEGVLHQLWELPEGVDFYSDPLPKEECSMLEEIVPSPLTPYFGDIRALCITLLQDRSIPLNERILLMGLRLQALKEEGADIPRWLAETEALLAAEKPSLKGLLHANDNAVRMYLTNNLQLLMNSDVHNILILKENLLKTLGVELGRAVKSSEGEMMEAKLENLVQQSITFEPSRYVEMQAEFEQIFGSKEYFFENLAVSIFFKQGYPIVDSPETLWKSYVTFCQMWSFYRFLAVLSVRVQMPPLPDKPDEMPPAPGSREALFQILAIAGRVLLHSPASTKRWLEGFWKNESTTLAHMAILLAG